MGETDTFEAYRLSIPNHDGPSLLVEREAQQLREALLSFWEELCPDFEREPEIPEDGVAIDILPVTVSDEEWREAADFEWEGFFP